MDGGLQGAVDAGFLPPKLAGQLTDPGPLREADIVEYKRRLGQSSPTPFDAFRFAMLEMKFQCVLGVDGLINYRQLLSHTPMQPIGPHHQIIYVICNMKFGAKCNM